MDSRLAQLSKGLSGGPTKTPSRPGGPREFPEGSEDPLPPTHTPPSTRSPGRMERQATREAGLGERPPTCTSPHLRKTRWGDPQPGSPVALGLQRAARGRGRAGGRRPGVPGGVCTHRHGHFGRRSGGPVGSSAGGLGA